jgi:serine protease Do
MKPAGFGEVAEKIRRSTVQIVSGNGRTHGVGSGILWSTGGTVITNAHVARDRSLRVELWDGRSIRAQVAARDDRADLASLKLEAVEDLQASGIPALAWRPARSLRPGELVIAVGNPMGFLGALTTGVVHTSGPIRGLGREPWIQASIRLAPGNSGGPLADAEGRVVGLNTMVVAGGLALAVPSEQVLDFLKRGSRPALGVVIRPVRFRPATHAQARAGLLIVQIEPGSPAEYVSLAMGDVLVAANGRAIESVDDLGAAIDDAAGTILRLRFLRGGQPNEREVAVAMPGLREAA